MSYFIELVRKPVYNPDGSPVGKLADLVVTRSEPLPVVSAGVVTTRRGTRMIPWSALQRQPNAYRLAAPLDTLPAYEPGDGDFRVHETLMDRQIVDLNDARIVRVNDVRFAEFDDQFCLVGVDAGLRGLLRSAGLEGIAERVADALRLPLHSELIGWHQIDTDNPVDSSGRVRLNVTRDKIARLHPAEIASLLSQASPAEREEIMSKIDVETAADALPEVEPEVQVAIIQSLEDERAADILEAMEPDEAADLLGDLPEHRKEDLLEQMEDEEAAEVEELLEYDDLVAGGLMTNAYVAVPEGLTVAQALERLRREAAEGEHVHYVYVCDEEERLVGVASLRELLIADPAAAMDEIMETRVRVVDAEASAEDVRQTMAKYGLLSVPVVDEEQRLLGVVTIDDVLDLIIPPEWRLRPSRSHAVASAND